MKKIPTIFIRNEHGVITREPRSACAFVFEGLGVARRKYNGTACRVLNDTLFKRYDCKAGKTPPPGFEPCEPTPDPITGHWPGWVPITGDDRWHIEAWSAADKRLPDGTYELCGPKIQKNPEVLTRHILIPHASAPVVDVPRTFDELRAFFVNFMHEGVVFYLDGEPRAKIKREDFARIH